MTSVRVKLGGKGTSATRLVVPNEQTLAGVGEGPFSAKRQTGPPRPRALAKALVAPAPVLDTGFASLLAVRSHRVMDAMFFSALVILPMIAFIALLFLLGSTEPTTAVSALDGTGMLILPP
jgi:hypothetical protein